MAVSNSIDFTVTRDSIITEVLEICGVLGEGETPTSGQLTSCSRSLNLMIKAWQADSVNLFAIQKVYLFTSKDTGVFTLSSTTSDHFTASFNTESVAVAGSSTDTTIEVDDASGISDGDYIGIASGTNVHWTTVNGIPAGNVVTLTDALVEDVAVDSVVYYYTSKANRPMKILEGYVHRYDGSDVPLDQVARVGYDTLSSKTSTGTTNQFYYDPQRTSAELNTWPVSTDERDYLILKVQRTLGDVDAAADEVDYPQEWYLAIVYGLAELIAPKMGTPLADRQYITAMARRYFDMASEFDNESETSLYFSPDRRGQERD